MSIVFNAKADGTIFGGGFRFDSLLQKSNLPTVVLQGGGSSQQDQPFSESFYESYALPFGLWVSNSFKSHVIRGGTESAEKEEEEEAKDTEGAEEREETKTSKVQKNDILAEDLHEKLLELVREKRIKKGNTKKNKKLLAKPKSEKAKTKKNYDL